MMSVAKDFDALNAKFIAYKANPTRGKKHKIQQLIDKFVEKYRPLSIFDSIKLDAWKDDCLQLLNRVEERK